MNREGLSKIRRAELIARLDALDAQIEAQANRAKYVRDMGWNAALSDERLKALQDARRLYLSALKHLLGDGAVDGRESLTTLSVPPPLLRSRVSKLRVLAWLRNYPAALLASARLLISLAQAFISASLKPGLTARLIDTAARSNACSSSIVDRTPIENLGDPSHCAVTRLPSRVNTRSFSSGNGCSGWKLSSDCGVGLFFNIGLRLRWWFVCVGG
jgi:hypothetical protein